MKRKYVSIMTYGGYRRGQVESNYIPETITVSEMIDELSKYPMDAPVYTWGDQGWGEIGYNTIEFNS